MTAKRFMIDDCGTLIDMHTRDTFDYVSDVCDLLNELAEENKALLRKNGAMEEEIECLSEENEKLKDIIKDIVVQLDANHTSHAYQMTIPINKVIYNELKRRLKETSFNEELRRFLDD